MPDVHSPTQRSYNMSRIKGKNTKPELLVRKFLFSKGFRFRVNDKRLPGKPDIVLPKYKTVIFVNGCFWHGHNGCKHATLPKTRIDWWANKLAKNQENDRKYYSALQIAGWMVIVVWTCDLQIQPKQTLNNLLRMIK